MEEDRVEVLSRQSNAAVVRMPGRSFPGVVIQGDSLRILHEALGANGVASVVVHVAALEAG